MITPIAMTESKTYQLARSTHLKTQKNRFPNMVKDTKTKSVRQKTLLKPSCNHFSWALIKNLEVISSLDSSLVRTALSSISLTNQWYPNREKPIPIIGGVSFAFSG